MHHAYQPTKFIKGNPPINHSYPYSFQQYQPPNSTRNYNQPTATFLYYTEPHFFKQNQHLHSSNFMECGNQVNNHHVSILNNYSTSCQSEQQTEYGPRQGYLPSPDYSMNSCDIVTNRNPLIMMGEQFS